jgi:hypothetical protein
VHPLSQRHASAGAAHNKTRAAPAGTSTHTCQTRTRDNSSQLTLTRSPFQVVSPEVHCLCKPCASKQVPPPQPFALQLPVQKAMTMKNTTSGALISPAWPIRYEAAVVLLLLKTIVPHPAAAQQIYTANTPPPPKRKTAAMVAHIPRQSMPHGQPYATKERTKATT